LTSRVSSARALSRAVRGTFTGQMLREREHCSQVRLVLLTLSQK
jgi:hypothetical protein